MITQLAQPGEVRHRRAVKKQAQGGDDPDEEAGQDVKDHYSEQRGDGRNEIRTVRGVQFVAVIEDPIVGAETVNIDHVNQGGNHDCCQRRFRERLENAREEEHRQHHKRRHHDANQL